MNSENRSNKPSLPAVPISLFALILLGALLFWWFRGGKEPPPEEPQRPMGSGYIEPFRTPGGALHTNGLRKTEELTKSTGSWRGTTTSGLRFVAVYRYDIELRDKDWNIFIDEDRKIAFVIAPVPKPQLPVAVDSKTVEEWTEGGWGRFDKWEQLQALRQEISPFLETRAKSEQYIDLARGDARKTVEEFVADWTLKNKGWPTDAQAFVKVYFADETDIPFPEGKTLKDFLP